MSGFSRRTFLVLALGLGFLGFSGVWLVERYKASEAFLMETMIRVQTVGPGASPTQCLEMTMNLFHGCEAMASLCQATVPRWMGLCLSRINTALYCEEVRQESQTAHFGFQTCKDLGYTRASKKACADSFRAIERHCREKHHLKSSGPE